MGRPKLCGVKITCKSRDGHDGDHDFGLEKKDDHSEADALKKQIAQLQNDLARSSPEALQARTATAELELARMQTSIREMAEGCRASGMTVLSSQLISLISLMNQMPKE